MTRGPVEVIVIAFPESRFNGRIVPEVRSLIDRGIIAVIDGLLVTKDDAGVVGFVEFEQDGLDEQLAEFRSLFTDAVEDLVSADDVEELAEGLAPGDSAAVLVFEHTWAKPFRDAVVDSGGRLVADFRVPGAVVDEVLEALETV